MQLERPSPQSQACHPEELGSPSRSPARVRRGSGAQNPPWTLSPALPLLPLALQPLPAQYQPFLPPLLTPLLVLLSRKKKMFLLDQKGTRERSPRSQCRGGPARGWKGQREGRGVRGDGGTRPHAPPCDLGPGDLLAGSRWSSLTHRVTPDAWSWGGGADGCALSWLGDH